MQFGYLRFLKLPVVSENLALMAGGDNAHLPLLPLQNLILSIFLGLHRFLNYEHFSGHSSQSHSIVIKNLGALLLILFFSADPSIVRHHQRKCGPLKINRNINYPFADHILMRIIALAAGYRCHYPRVTV